LSVSIIAILLLVIFIATRSDPNGVSVTQDVMTMLQLWLTRSGAASRGVGRDNAIATVSILTYLLVIVIGASAVGAEYRAGTVGTVLTWEPRRHRLLIARLFAAAIVGMGFFLLVHVVFVGAWVIGVAVNGQSSGANAEFWRDLVILIVRATLLAGALAVISGALATLGRNTAAAMGLWFGYLIVIEAVLRGQVDDAVPWFLTSNVGAFYAWEAVTQNAHTVSAGSGALRLVLYVGLIGGAALLVFQRRDVA
jgi:ABC-type transport system involved in multi-copper enzyme maturation permease subunit